MQPVARCTDLGRAVTGAPARIRHPRAGPRKRATIRTAQPSSTSSATFRPRRSLSRPSRRTRRRVLCPLAINGDGRLRSLNLLAGLHRIEDRRSAGVEPKIARLVERLIADPTIRSIITGASSEIDDSLTGPTLEQLLPGPAQRVVLRRTFSALGVNSCAADWFR